MRDLVAAAGVLIILGGVMIIAKLCANRLTPEASRKTIHITMGCTALSFPFVFEHRQSVIFLGISAIAVLLFLRKNESLRGGIGTALLGVERKSLGDVYFVISIVIVYVMYKSVFEFLIPIAVLTFADSVAALVGTSYGRYNLAQHDDEATKSSEGSIMFFIVAFICTLIPLQLMTEVGRAEVLVISFLIGFLAAIIEAVTRHGNDNLLLPLLTYNFLRYNIGQPLSLLFTNLGFMLLLLAAIFVVYKMTNITRLSIAYSLLVGYIIMIQGGILWVLPPLMLFLTFGILPAMKEEEKSMVQTYKVIECNTIVGVICLLLAVFFPAYRDLLYLSFSLSFAIHLAINTYSRLINFQNTSVKVSTFWGLAKAVGFIVLPSLFITRMRWPIFVLYLIVLTVTMPFAISLNKKYNYKKVGEKTFSANKILVGSLVAVFSAVLTLAGGFYDLFG